MRTHYCGEINTKHLSKKVKICGWINKIRDIGKIIFIDIRDQEGIVQVIFSSKIKNTFQKVKTLKIEYCVQISGIVKKRNPNNINLNIYTGKIEIFAHKLKILNISKDLPLDFNKNNSIKTRLKYRYLDIRRSNIINNLKIKHLIIKNISNFLNTNKFFNIETPFLTKSTPEGARDYIVPSRLNLGKFYALPQSPQLFKQILMMSGIDRYYQIVKCFRDEDLRSNRQPEFTQIDIETSFMKSNKLCKLMEKMIINLWLKIKNIQLNNIHKISFNESLKRFGTDKPDLRNPLEIIDIDDLFKNTLIFKNVGSKSYRTITLKIPNGINLKDEKINFYIKILNKQFIKNFFIMVVQNLKLKQIYTNFFILKKLDLKIEQEIIQRNQSKEGDIIFFVHGSQTLITKTLGKLRNIIGKDCKIINKNKWSVVWIKNFPLFKKNSNNTFSCMHHPFTSPKNLNILKLLKNPIDSLSKTYDMIINGEEIGGGSVRIHNKKLQETIFKIIGLNKQEQKNKFGFFLHALKYGTPPHAGIAFGLDRIAMLLTNSKYISDVIAFPKTTSGKCLMTQAPEFINTNFLNELGIKLK
ncbi:aspartate--tRNA ligase [Buchnera aphidicola]|uniref:aspartate--tRNA ligase n=1 Tax=Buchnera aphidicola TaxID=9 RepID=UPI002238CD13|nr:aspartate--tRNA ligase [Buchnera aphidicola]MCW5197716.1 aspartate--tRNA ligase [Buchnera aphidicola (Chaitophorus viminalis)]